MVFKHISWSTGDPARKSAEQAFCDLQLSHRNFTWGWGGGVEIMVIKLIKFFFSLFKLHPCYRNTSSHRLSLCHHLQAPGPVISCAPQIPLNPSMAFNHN